MRIGGWGELFGDEGSAYWIAIRGLNAFSRMSDGRLPQGPLAGVLRRHLDAPSDLDVIDIVHNRWKGDRGPIAALSRQVAEAADLGDDHRGGHPHRGRSGARPARGCDPPAAGLRPGRDRAGVLFRRHVRRRRGPGRVQHRD